ncbi:MAG: APC family permease [Candidatus Caldarchaeales archaeon]
MSDKEFIPREIFARRASGLVRQASFIDAFSFGFMNQGIAIALWMLLSWGVFLFPSGDLLGSVILSVIFTLPGVALVWGILAASMPRSGGCYIYNSRIIHPAIGMAVSFGDFFIWWLWIVILSPWIADPGLTTLFGMIDAVEAAEWVKTPIGMFTVATTVNILGFSFAFYGLRWYLLHQKIVMTLSIITLATVGIILGMHTNADFVSAWNKMAAEYGSLSYNEMIEAAKEAYPEIFTPTLPIIFGTLGLMVVNSWWAHYGWAVSVIGGEVKRPQRNLLLSQIGAIIVPAVFALIFSIIYPRVVGVDFMRALSIADNVGLEGYNMPFPANFVGMSRVFIDTSTFTGVLLAIFASLSLILADYIWIPMSYVAASRIAVAWGMDRMGPLWLSEVHPKWASPLKNLVFIFVTSEIGIILYSLNPEWFAGLAVTATECVSIWGVTAIAAIIFPFIGKARTIWETSPYKRWKIGPIPILTIAGIIDVVYIGILLYFFYTTPGLEAVTPLAIMWFLGLWIFGAAWYYGWRWRWKKKGIEIDLAWRELPPE